MQDPIGTTTGATIASDWGHAAAAGRPYGASDVAWTLGMNALLGGTGAIAQRCVAGSFAAAAKGGEGLLGSGQTVFRSGRRYIVQDIDSHAGGIWKMANSPGALGTKTTRMGTYDEQLNRIGP